MKIGLDFDNTIVSYDTLFYKVAVEQRLLLSGIPVSKLAIRDYLRSVGKEDAWTEMQGLVYGARMSEATAYPGVFEFIDWASKNGHGLAIISHKTKHPFIGPRYDLHAAAKAWINQHLKLTIPVSNQYFELTKEEKLTRIADWGCDFFVDDLPEILLTDLFPAQTRGILFDPDGNHNGKLPANLTVIHSWAEIPRCLS